MDAFNLAAIHEAIASAIPDRECIVAGGRRLTWAQVTERTRRLANYLRARGIGCHRERAALRNWESGQDHVALYLLNRPEYLEGMLGAFKARAAPFNVNYRYVDDELAYLLADADARVIIYQARFAPALKRVRPRLPGCNVFLQVADDSGEPLLPGAADYEAALASASPERPPLPWSPDDLYILYTGGTTGAPKGVLWRQEDIFFAAMGGAMPGQPRIGSVEELVERALESEIRALPAPPLMHGASQWLAFTTLHQGGTVVLQRHPEHLDPHDIWSVVEREKVQLLAIVGDAFARPLLDALREHAYDLSSLRAIVSGGATLSVQLKRALLERLPAIMVLDAFGASESGVQASQLTAQGAASSGAFTAEDGTVVLRKDLSGILPPGSPEVGWVARRGHVPLGYYKDPEKTARTFPVVDGVRCALPGDDARAEADGSVTILGRGSACINTGGEKVYAEEVEEVLRAHPAVADAVVVGTAHPRLGQQVTALVSLVPGARLSAEELKAFASRHLARYKLPRTVLFVPEVVRHPSGKADYRWAESRARSAGSPGGGK